MKTLALTVGAFTLILSGLPHSTAEARMTWRGRTGWARTAKKRVKKRRRTHRWFRQLKPGPGFRLKDKRHAWGQRMTLRHLRQTFAAYRKTFPKRPDIVVHDISQRWGGRFRPHLSHRTGADVDIRLALKKHTDKYVRASPRTLNLETTWFLISTLINTGDVAFIFLDHRLQRALYRYARKRGVKKEVLSEVFQYPRRRRLRRGIVRHERGHADHIHVRFSRGFSAKRIAVALPTKLLPTDEKTAPVRLAMK